MRRAGNCTRQASVQAGAPMSESIGYACWPDLSPHALPLTPTPGPLQRSASSRPARLPLDLSVVCNNDTAKRHPAGGG